MKTVSKVLVLLGAVALVSCEVFFEEKFVDGKLTFGRQMSGMFDNLNGLTC